MKKYYEVISISEEKRGYLYVTKMVISNTNKIRWFDEEIEVIFDEFNYGIIEETKKTTCYKNKMVIEAEDVFGYKNTIVIKQISGFTARKKKKKQHGWA